MKIASIRATPLSSPIEPVQERPFHGGVRKLRKRDVVVVEVETPDGLVGISTAGATSSAMREFFEDTSHATFADVLNEEVAPSLEGSDLGPGHSLIQACQGLSIPATSITKAISALDVALFDLQGKRVGAPVFELLDDDNDKRPLSLYASAGMYMEPSGYRNQALALAERGFQGYKYRPGVGPEKDRATVEELGALTADIDIMADAHTWWKLRDRYGWKTTTELVEIMAEEGFTWIEEPVEPSDHDGYRRLFKQTGAPLAGGESEPDPNGLRSLAETESIQYLQGDVRHHHGFSGCWDVVSWCTDSDVTFVPHNFGTSIGLVANGHLVTAMDESVPLEYPVFEGDPRIDADQIAGMYSFPLAFEIIEESLDVADGIFTFPEGPGLGITLDRSVFEQYPHQPGAWTEFVYD